MKSKNSLAVIAGILIMAGCIAAAIKLQSAYLLYAATAVPILLVPFIPDIKTSRTLKPGGPSSRIRIYRTGQQDGQGFIVIEAAPGAIPWSKRRLYFPVTGIPSAPAPKHSMDTAGIPVLQYDLVRHRRKKHLYGIELANLAARFRTLSYTPDEVTRLVVRMEDLAAAGSTHTGTRSSAMEKGLQA